MTAAPDRPWSLRRRLTGRVAAPAAGQDAPTSRQPIRLEGGDLEHLIVAADADAVAILLRNLLKNGTGKVRVALSPDGRLWIAPRRHRRPAAGAFAHRAGASGRGLACRSPGPGPRA